MRDFQPSKAWHRPQRETEIHLPDSVESKKKGRVKAFFQQVSLHKKLPRLKQKGDIDVSLTAKEEALSSSSSGEVTLSTETEGTSQLHDSSSHTGVDAASSLISSQDPHQHEETIESTATSPIITHDNPSTDGVLGEPSVLPSPAKPRETTGIRVKLRHLRHELRAWRANKQPATCPSQDGPTQDVPTQSCPPLDDNTTVKQLLEEDDQESAVATQLVEQLVEEVAAAVTSVSNVAAESLTTVRKPETTDTAQVAASDQLQLIEQTVEWEVEQTIEQEVEQVVEEVAAAAVGSFSSVATHSSFIVRKPNTTETARTAASNQGHSPKKITKESSTDDILEAISLLKSIPGKSQQCPSSIQLNSTNQSRPSPRNARARNAAAVGSITGVAVPASTYGVRMHSTLGNSITEQPQASTVVDARLQGAAPVPQLYGLAVSSSTVEAHSRRRQAQDGNKDTGSMLSVTKLVVHDVASFIPCLSPETEVASPLVLKCAIPYIYSVHMESRDLALNIAQRTNPSVDTHVFWTDASRATGTRAGGKGGISVAHQRFDCQWIVQAAHVTGLDDVAHLEALAVCQALQIALPEVQRMRRHTQAQASHRVVVFTDSQAVLRALDQSRMLLFAIDKCALEVKATGKFDQSLDGFRHAILPLKIYSQRKRLGDSLRSRTFGKVEAAARALLELGAAVEFRWIPGHSGVPGNEIADVWAGRAREWYADVIPDVPGVVGITPLKIVQFCLPGRQHSKGFTKLVASTLLGDARAVQVWPEPSGTAPPARRPVAQKPAPSKMSMQVRNEAKPAEAGKAAPAKQRGPRRQKPRNAQQNLDEATEVQAKTIKKCSRCGKTGHIEDVCRLNKKAKLDAPIEKKNQELQKKVDKQAVTLVLPWAFNAVARLHPGMADAGYQPLVSAVGRVGLFLRLCRTAVTSGTPKRKVKSRILEEERRRILDFYKWPRTRPTV